MGENINKINSVVETIFHDMTYCTATQKNSTKKDICLGVTRSLVSAESLG